ncbi:MAG TPA: acyloxyacyl hydrolase [Bacteroidales bacterium]|nr:acyloxyacyl hydrolase [Bacteroidales bacterium]
MFLAPGIITDAQEKNTFFIGSQAHYGFIIAHSDSIAAASHTNPTGIEIDLNWLHTNYDSWKVFRHYNISGIQLGYYNYGSPDIVGKSYLLSFYTEPILSRGNRYYFSVRAGAGISYQTKVFDFVTDTLNKFFSTRLAFPLNLSARFRYRLSPELYLTASAVYNHISNGAVKVPNFGINFPTAALGLEYFPKQLPAFDQGYTPSASGKMRQQYFLVQMIEGYKWVYGEATWSYGLGIRYGMQLRNYYALNAGAELLLDGSIKRMRSVLERSFDYKRFGLTFGQDFILGKITFSQMLGVYLYSPYKPKHPVYQKYELSYKIIKPLNAGIYLKAHTSDADMFGFMVNFYFRK